MQFLRISDTPSPIALFLVIIINHNNISSFFNLPSQQEHFFRSAEGLSTNDVMQYMKIYLFRDNVSVNHQSQQQQQSIFFNLTSQQEPQ